MGLIGEAVSAYRYGAVGWHEVQQLDEEVLDRCAGPGGVCSGDSSLESTVDIARFLQVRHRHLPHPQLRQIERVREAAGSARRASRCDANDSRTAAMLSWRARRS